MDKLWAPWRIKYIESKKEKKCIFCTAAVSKTNKYVIFKTRYCLSILNAFPYNNGHSMVAPLKHIREFSQLKDPQILDLIKCVDTTKRLLNKVLKPDGYNIGINISRSAGAGIPGHLHIHIVPRWKGDTNFMATVYNTKVISQSLEDLYQRLRHVKSKAD